MVTTCNSLKLGQQPPADPVLLYSDAAPGQSATGPAYEVELKASFTSNHRNLHQAGSSDFKGVGFLDASKWKAGGKTTWQLRECKRLTGGTTCWRAWGKILKIPGVKNK